MEAQTELLHRYVIIDRSIVWYGNVDYLSYCTKDANALRFEGPDIAGELLDLRREDKVPNYGLDYFRANQNHLHDELHPSCK